MKDAAKRLAPVLAAFNQRLASPDWPSCFRIQRPKGTSGRLRWGFNAYLQSQIDPLEDVIGASLFPPHPRRDDDERAIKSRCAPGGVTREMMQKKAREEVVASAKGWRTPIGTPLKLWAKLPGLDEGAWWNKPAQFTIPWSEVKHPKIRIAARPASGSVQRAAKRLTKWMTRWMDGPRKDLKRRLAKARKISRADRVARIYMGMMIDRHLFRCRGCRKAALDTSGRGKRTWCERCRKESAHSAPSMKQLYHQRRAEKLTRARNAIKRCTATGDWKAEVIEAVPGLSRKFLTMAVNDGDLKAPA